MRVSTNLYLELRYVSNILRNEIEHCFPFSNKSDLLYLLMSTEYNIPCCEHYVFVTVDTCLVGRPQGRSRLVTQIFGSPATLTDFAATFVDSPRSPWISYWGWSYVSK